MGKLPHRPEAWREFPSSRGDFRLSTHHGASLGQGFSGFMTFVRDVFKEIIFAAISFQLGSLVDFIFFYYHFKESTLIWGKEKDDRMLASSARVIFL